MKNAIMIIKDKLHTTITYISLYIHGINGERTALMVKVIRIIFTYHSLSTPA